MRKVLGFVAAFAVLATGVGCGDKGAEKATAPADPKSAVGAWTADAAPLIAMLKPLLQMGVQMAEGAAGSGANPEEAKKNLADAKKKLADLDQMKMVLDLKADGTGTMDMPMPGNDAENGPRTLVWSQAGEQVTITPKTSNGKPLTGKQAETKIFTLKDNEMSMTDAGIRLVFKRK
jgi:hypothetical protein